jgi:2'-5' RNA ligase
MSDAVRAFLAFEIPEQVKAELTASREIVRAELPRARWVRPEGQHLTLKFLDEVPRSTLDELARDLAPPLGRVPSVTVELHGAGFFPSPRRSRVAWVGGLADGADAVVAAIDEVAAVHGFDRERRRWSPHVTQARLNRPWPADAVDRFLEWGRDLRLEPFVAREVVLFSSVLRPEGAVYTALERIPLG